MLRLFQPSAEECALVAVSGGRDSVALLHWLLEQGCRSLVVCHLNHGLRGRESGQDAAFVRRLASRHGLLCEVRRADAAALARREKISVETAGRRLRHEFFREMAVKHGARRVFLAHHADDQAETILAQLCRGAGLAGLAGMAVESPLPGVQGAPVWLTRPLLGWRRADMDAFLAARGLRYREDSSNAKAGPRRNRLRHKVLPLLCQIFERDVAPLLARCAQQAARDEDALQAMAGRLLAEHVLPDAGLRVAPALKSAHPALLSRVLFRWLTLTCAVPGIGFAEVSEAMRLLEPAGPARINLPAGHHLRRKAGRLWVQRPGRGAGMSG
ncbi:MAG: tRNA lysidine(34) synthetase TilS [Prosthecobacter sp.]|nr:tRNA lysidine(34) synthetase TilS [Prosthecobacter sp.]